MENLAFHSFTQILPILTTSLMHFSLKGCENVLFELGSEIKKEAELSFEGLGLDRHSTRASIWKNITASLLCSWLLIPVNGLIVHFQRRQLGKKFAHNLK